jgi:hypothetical protein
MNILSSEHGEKGQVLYVEKTAAVMKGLRRKKKL